jgi:riboflavin kinase / FMN adenylyltransferase
VGSLSVRVVAAGDPAPADLRGASLALGNFDGLHAGHRAVVARARDLGDDLGVPIAVATFDPAPRRHFHPDAPAFRIQTPLRRNLTLEALGVDACFVLAFDAAMAQLTDREFVASELVRRLGVRSVCTGPDFRFGRDRMGDVETLARLGREFGFSTAVVEEVVSEGQRVSSSMIRDLIEKGEVAAAGAALGGYWILDGVVEHGEKRGRTLGFPTANLRLGEIVAPRFGIYAVWARPDEATDWTPGVANFGRTPTTGLRDPLLEVVLFDWEGDLYGRRLHVAFADFIRPEAKFGSLDELVAAMGNDAAEARRRLAKLPFPPP